MKKILLLSVFILTAMCSFAGTGVKFGVKAGANVGSVTNASVEIYSANRLHEMAPLLKLSVYAGVLVEVPMGNIWSLQPEAIYTRQGASYGIAGQDVRAWLRLNYINIPLLARARVSDHVKIEFGPQVSFLLNSSLRIKENGNSETIRQNWTEKIDVGAVAGAGFLLWESTDLRTLELNARINVGFIDVQKNDLSENIYFSPGKMFNYNLQTGLTFRF